MKVHILFRDLFCFAHIPCLPRSKVTASYLYPVKVIMASTGLACRHVYKTTFYSSTIYLTLSIRQLSSVRRPRLYRTEFSYRVKMKIPMTMLLTLAMAWMSSSQSRHWADEGLSCYFFENMIRKYIFLPVSSVGLIYTVGCAN